MDRPQKRWKSGAQKRREAKAAGIVINANRMKWGPNFVQKKKLSQARRRERARAARIPRVAAALPLENASSLSVPSSPRTIDLDLDVDDRVIDEAVPATVPAAEAVYI
jgi:hypothetical protein